jgi:hypothetical protein
MAKDGAECARDERPANLLFWFGDGHCSGFDARVAADVEVSIGRTNSERALGFIVTSGKRHVDFVLDRDQVAELAAFLHIALSRLRSPLGRKPDQLSLVAASLPKRRLFTALQNAAIDAHPGWHRINDHVCEADDGAPDGARLVAWFKKTHPRAAERIERALTKKLWEGK